MMCSVDWSVLANWGLVLVAMRALCVAKLQINETGKLAATSLYNHCLELSLNYPKLAEPALSGGFKKLVSQKPEIAAQYGWYVASMLLSCEEILTITKNDKEWRASVLATLNGHTEYFRYRNESETPLHETYEKELLSVIDELTANPKMPLEARALKMARLS